MDSEMKDTLSYGYMHYMIVVSLEMSDDPIFSSNFKERMPAPIKGNKDLVLIVATTLRCGKLLL